MSKTLCSDLDVLDFWWQAGPPKWFASDDAFDQSCKDRFGDTVEAALSGALDHWAETPAGALALILVLDQLPRNIFRGSARAFAGDDRALAIAERAIANAYDRAFPKDVRVFFYLPFEHAEDITAQERSVDLSRRLGIENFYHYALIHMDVIRRFGRFPHRNAILGRETTEEEKAYLEDGGFSA
ncbi:MAG: DUF924 domain-containing protein [Roseibium sp.]|nr:DUF924 domain-containing protein [Roseibium sp.]